MKKITLVEDTCLGKNLDINTEISKLLQQGYKITHQYTHPAIGKVVDLIK